MADTEDLGYAEEVVNEQPTTKTKTKTRAKKKVVTEVVNDVQNAPSRIIKIEQDGTVDLSTVPAEKVEALKTKAASLTVDNIMNLGAKAQSNISASADILLEHTRSTDVNVIGDSLLSLTKEMKQIDINKLQPMNGFKRFIYSLPGMKSLRMNVATLFAKYDNVAGNIDGILTSLNQGRIAAVKDNEALSQMRNATEKNIEDITDDLIVAELKINELRNELAEMKANADQYESIEISDKQLFIDNLERRVNDLAVTNVVMKQQLVDIQLIRQGNDVMTQKIQSTIQNTIPIWRSTMAMGVTLARQKAGIEKVKAVADYTNQMLKDKAKMLGQNVTEIAKENERAVIDFETVKEVHNTTLNTLKEIEQIQEEGRKQREATKINIKKLTDEMERQVINNGAEKSAIAAKDTKRK